VLQRVSFAVGVFTHRQNFAPFIVNDSSDIETCFGH